ncbi:MAG: sigma-70 region 4 domain-containing protein, partial [Lachnospiraceae bacterium]|nr:sigma-70 region 4 domain-containing protein [Lachnospiraceae bacterium]
ARQLEDIVIDNYNYENLMKKIEKLPEKYKEMLIMHYLFGLPVKEIAVQMSLSENNAYTRICRARSLLKEMMEMDNEE